MKPLGIKNYGSIGHLPMSRLGPGDHKVPDGQAAICTTKARDKHDTIIVTEKLDGSNVGVVRAGGQLLALGRAGYLAQSSKYEQHQLFAAWLRYNEDRFAALPEGHRIVGEWLAQAHSTRYDLGGRLPFVAFDVMVGINRLPFEAACDIADRCQIPTPAVLSYGPPISIEDAMERLGNLGFYGATDTAEGLVYRVERHGKYDFMAKYVRPDKVDGALLPEQTGGEAVWNWRPSA